MINLFYSIWSKYIFGYQKYFGGGFLLVAIIEKFRNI